MSDLRTAAQRALEALELVTDLTNHDDEIYEAITALRAALAQQDESVDADAAYQRWLADTHAPALRRMDSQGAFSAGWQAALAQQAEPVEEPITRLFGTLPVHDTQQALAQQDEPLNLRDPAVQKRLATQWGYVSAAQAEPVEPVAWRYKPMIGSSWSLSDDGYYISCKRDKGYIVDSLYTTPQQRKPLTEGEIDGLVIQHAGYGRDNFYAVVRAVERAHGIGDQP